MTEAEATRVGDLEFLELPLDDLNEAAYNPRDFLEPGTPEHEKLKNSLEGFGLVDPLVWNKQTRTLVGGHQRLRILREMGAERVVVTVVDLDEEREKALNLALNNPNLQGRFNPHKLIQVASEMSPELLRLAGYDDTGEIQDMLRRAELADTSFLGDFLRGDGEMSDDVLAGRAREIDLKDEHAHRTGPQMFDITLVFTAEQRAIYYLALDRAKRHYSTDNTYNALASLLDDWNKRWEAEHADAGVPAD